MKKMSWSALATMSVIVFALGTSPSVAHAAEVENRVVTVEDQEGALEKVNAFLDEPDVEGVILVSPQEPSLREDDGVSLCRAVTIKTKYAANKKMVRRYTSFSERIGIVSGNPGLTISISKTASVSNSYSATVTISTASISACLGFSVESSESLSMGASFKVPSKSGGKSVKRGYIYAYPVYEKYTFDIRERSSRGGVPLGSKKIGTGTANRAVGVYFKKVLTYK